MIKYVVGFVFNKALNEVLLIEKNKPDWQKGKLNGIGGKVEDGESSLDAMSREFFEETNISIEQNNWKPVGKMNGDNWTCDIFTSIIEDFETSNLIANKTSEMVWVCVMKNENNYDGYNLCLPSRCIANLYWLIPMCIDLNTGIDSYAKSFETTIKYK